VNRKLIIFFIISVNLLLAQTTETLPSLFNDIDRESPKYKTSMEQYYKTRSMLRTVAPQILEKELEDAQYIVGPGDQFTLYVYGELEVSLDFTIMPEGQVYIPTIGKIDLSGLTLKEAKKRVLEKAKNYYLNADISVNLISLRKFRVYLVGEVTKPGTYFVQGSNRVSDILELAGGVKDWADLTAVELKHSDKTVEDFNIMRFYRYGDKNENPFMKGGDVIFVRSIDLTRPHILVESKIEKVLEAETNRNQSQSTMVNQKSTRKIYHLLDDETVISFLNRISAFSADIDLTKITLERDSVEYVMDLLNEYSKYEKFDLQSKDRLIIPSLLSVVYVQGEVMNPGEYSFDVNLTANDYISKAGIIEKSKPGEDVIIIRKGTGEVLKGSGTIVYKGDTIIVPRKTREDVRDYILILVPILTMGLSLLTLLNTTK